MAAEFSGDVIGARRMQGPACDGGKIGMTIVIDVLDLLIDQLHAPIRRGERRKIRQRERHHGAPARFEHPAVSLLVIMRGLHNGQVESHALQPHGSWLVSGPLDRSPEGSLHLLPKN